MAISESIGVARREGATDTQLLRLIFVTVNSWSRCHLVTMTIIIIISCCAGPMGECIPSCDNIIIQTILNQHKTTSRTILLQLCIEWFTKVYERFMNNRNATLLTDIVTRQTADQLNRSYTKTR